MSDSQNIFEQLSAYLDGELPPDQARQVEQALSQDASLAAQLEALRANRERLRHLPLEKPPEDFVARVLAQAERMQLVEQAASRPPRTLQWIRYAATAAVALIAASVGFSIAVSLITTSKLGQDVAQDNRASGERVAIGPSAADRRDRERSPESAGPARGLLEKSGDGLARAEKPSPPADETIAKLDDRTERMSKAAAPRVMSKVGKDGMVDEGIPEGTPAEPESSAAFFAAAPQTDLYINTDKLPETQREVEKTLVSNGVVPVVQESNLAQRASKQLDRRLAQQANNDLGQLSLNSFQSRSVKDEEVVYEVVATDEQAKGILRGINLLKARQNVSQMAAVPVQASNAPAKVAVQDGLSYAQAAGRGKYYERPAATTSAASGPDADSVHYKVTDLYGGEAPATLPAQALTPQLGAKKEMEEARATDLKDQTRDQAQQAQSGYGMAKQEPASQAEGLAGANRQSLAVDDMRMERQGALSIRAQNVQRLMIRLQYVPAPTRARTAGLAATVDAATSSTSQPAAAPASTAGQAPAAAEPNSSGQ